MADGGPAHPDGPVDEGFGRLTAVLSDEVVGQPVDVLPRQPGGEQGRAGVVGQQPGALDLGGLGLRVTGIGGVTSLAWASLPGGNSRSWECRTERSSMLSLGDSCSVWRSGPWRPLELIIGTFQLRRPPGRMSSWPAPLHPYQLARTPHPAKFRLATGVDSTSRPNARGFWLAGTGKHQVSRSRDGCWP
jgi:hypothetical protein